MTKTQQLKTAKRIKTSKNPQKAFKALTSGHATENEAQQILAQTMRESWNWYILILGRREAADMYGFEKATSRVSEALQSIHVTNPDAQQTLAQTLFEMLEGKTYLHQTYPILNAATDVLISRELCNTVQQTLVKIIKTPENAVNQEKAKKALLGGKVTNNQAQITLAELLSGWRHYAEAQEVLESGKLTSTSAEEILEATPRFNQV